MIKKSHSFIPFLLFLISFGVYLKTLCPTVYVGDSGELIAAAYTLGIPHPPGYPLYCLLGKLFTFLPFGSIAYQINLMSAFFASLTVVLIYLILLKIQNTGKLANWQTNRRTDEQTGRLADWQTGRLFTRHVPAISASLLFAFSSTFWSQAVVAEVYTLNTFFLTLVIYLLLTWQEKRDVRLLFLSSLFYGLAFCSHLMQITFLPAILFFIFINESTILSRGKELAMISFLFILGLSLYLYLPPRSLANPPIDWGNPENLRNFWYHITVKQYHTKYLFSLSLPQILDRMKGIFFLHLRQFSAIGLLISLLGIGRLFKKGKLGLFFVLIILGDLFYILFLNTISLEKTPFGIPSYLVVTIGIGYGISYLLEKGAQINERHGINLGGKSLYRCVASLLILVLPLTPLTKNYFQNDKSSCYITYDYGMNVLKTLEKNAILFTDGDIPSFALAYLQIVEKKRPDVTVYSPNINPFFRNIPDSRKKPPWQGRMIERIIVKSKEAPSIYYIWGKDLEHLPGYMLRPKGILFKLTKEGALPEKEPDPWASYELRGIDDKRIFKDYQTRIIVGNYYYHLMAALPK